jgi:hypothetical protein
VLSADVSCLARSVGSLRSAICPKSALNRKHWRALKTTRMTHHVDSRPPIAALRKIHSPLMLAASHMRQNAHAVEFYKACPGRLNCGQARSAIDVWSTTMMIGKMA